MKLITQTPEWQSLAAHKKIVETQPINDAFLKDATRFDKFSLRFNGILLDYSKNHITTETLLLLKELAIAAKLPEKINSLFEGHNLNSSEQQPALHTALRNFSSQEILVNNENVMAEVHESLAKMRILVTKIRRHEWLGITKKPITTIVNIGMGGSHLGARMATHALDNFSDTDLSCFFISNIDSAHLHEVLCKINPETTLFIISSKSFTTLETLTNAKTLKKWLQNALQTQDVSAHFVAVTANLEKAVAFGVPKENILKIQEWVGGRYSVWSAVGLPLAIMIGMENFIEFLQGAHEMDKHFRQADFLHNMPILLALIGVWYINFFGSTNHAIIPYTHRLRYFQDHLQQVDMESNGKAITHAGEHIHYATGPILWGEQGCNGQHAFHQLLHQGQHTVPVDFILVGTDNDVFQEHQDILIASGLSQAQALMKGKTFEDAFAELINANYPIEDAHKLAAHKTIPGNRPSNTLFVDSITPKQLGALLALYEHKIFVQGVIWDINSFDQWGVELGKQLLPQIYDDLTSATENCAHDSSTSGLINYYKELICKNG